MRLRSFASEIDSNWATFTQCKHLPNGSKQTSCPEISGHSWWKFSGPYTWNCESFAAEVKTVAFSDDDSIFAGVVFNAREFVFDISVRDGSVKSELFLTWRSGKRRATAKSYYKRQDWALSVDPYYSERGRKRDLIVTEEGKRNEFLLFSVIFRSFDANGWVVLRLRTYYLQEDLLFLQHHKQVIVGVFRKQLPLYGLWQSSTENDGTRVVTANEVVMSFENTMTVSHQV